MMAVSGSSAIAILVLSENPRCDVAIKGAEINGFLKKQREGSAAPARFGRMPAKILIAGLAFKLGECPFAASGHAVRAWDLSPSAVFRPLIGVLYGHNSTYGNFADANARKLLPILP
jgi:hypothetical protein